MILSKTLNFIYISFMVMTQFIMLTAASQISTKATNPFAADSIRIADLREAIKDYSKKYRAAPAYSTAFSLASAFSLLGPTDSAFKYLNISIQYDSSLNVLTEPDFIALKTDRRWAKLANTVLENNMRKNGKPIKHKIIANTLLEMYAKDQAGYKEMEWASEKLGMYSQVPMAIRNLKKIINDRNVEELEKIIDKIGWAGVSDVGMKANNAAFLIIQHSTLQKQQFYLPRLFASCKKKESRWESYALMYDRVQLGLGKKQYYGSQVQYNGEKNRYELLPLEDEKNVEERRRAAGMMALGEYLKLFDIEYKPKHND